MLRLVLLPMLVALATALVSGWLAQKRMRAMLTDQSRPLRHPALEAVTRRLAEALEIERIEVLELRTEAVNGLADVDGRVFLTSGMLREMESGRVTPEELATAIAHELGHVALGHAARRMRDVTGHQTAVMAGSILLSRLLPIIGPWLLAQISTALISRASRRDEFAADAWATALLLRAGIDISAQTSLLRKIERLAGVDGTAIPEWLRSHPLPEERIRAIEANEARWLRDRM